MYLSPVFQENQFTDNVEFLVGGLLWTYKAGTSEFALTYQDQSGTTPWPNPIILNSRGEIGGELWLSSEYLNGYRFDLESKPAYGQDHGVLISQFDYVTGVNAPATEAADNWVQLDKSPNYIDSNEFSVEGDYRGIFVTNRKIQIVDSTATSVQSVISSSLIAGFTRVEVSATIDAGISSVKYSNVAPDASPDRFTDLTLSGDLTVGDGLTVDGNTTLAGTLNSVAMADYWTDVNNTFGTSTSPSVGYINFANGLKIYRETFTASLTASTVFNGTKNFSSPMPTECLQVIACFGEFTSVYSPNLEVRTISASGFTYRVRMASNPPDGEPLVIRFIAIGY